MPDYTDMILADLKAAGWTAEVTEPSPGRFVAKGCKAGHTCIAESDGELGALAGLLKSVREVEAGRMFAVGMVVRLREPFGDLREGHYVVDAVDGEGLTVCMLGEDEAGEMCRTEKRFRVVMAEAGSLVRTSFSL